MSFISVAAGQPIRATHVQQFTAWLTGLKLDTPGTIACTSTTEYTLTVRSQDGGTGLALNVLYGSSGSPSTIATFNKERITLASPVRVTGTTPMAFAQMAAPASGPAVGHTSLYATTNGTLAFKAGVSTTENVLLTSDSPTVSGLLTLAGTSAVLASLETPLTDGLPVQDGDSYSRMAVSEGSTSPTAETLAPMINFQRRAAHNAVDTTQSSDYYFQSTRFGSVAQALTTASSGNATGIAVAGAGWVTNAFAGMQLDIVTGTGSGQRAIVASNTATAITITGSFSTTPDNTSQVVVNSGGAPDLYAHAVYAYDLSTAKPMNSLHNTIAISGFSKQSSTAAGTAFGGLLLGEMDSAVGNAIGLEIDIVNNSGTTASTYPTNPRSTIALNIASFASDAGYSGTNNSLGILLQSNGSAGAMLTGMLFGANSVRDYAIDFSPLSTTGATTPIAIRLGSNHQIVGRNASGTTDYSLLYWGLDDVLRMRSPTQLLFESSAGVEWARFNSSGLQFALTGQRIYGDFSTSALANRLMFQSSTTNGDTNVAALPNGTGSNASWIAANSSNITSAQALQIRGATTRHRIASIDLGTGATLPVGFYFGTTQTFGWETNGDVVMGSAALATNATSGFLFVASCDGAPTGTPTTYTGRVPHVVDTTNGRAYWYYSSAWHYATLT